ncbi:PAS domain-containing protein [Paenibacillus sp. N4]|uniref:two-component system sensor histidine kinase NtrB n=1 Tax=Paenibacillus vietnamensis TaxID=2590547 RepID=UPI001CD04767|nr:ATP-binding protein [Paenibacillus vietnamensis]MCA0756110.1 PAS domain-containing protein [Paenibacillus vietnamensis]
MLKELLLQFVVSLLPIFAFQLWYDQENRKGISVFMCIFCSVSMALCMLTAADVNGFEVDFRLIPYMIGSLYGGFPALGILTLLYILMRIPMLDNVWETASFFLFIVSFVPLLYLSIKPFQRASALRKERNGLLLMSVLMLYFIISLFGYISASGFTWTVLMVLTLVLAVTSSLTATWLSVFMIESVIEKKRLHREVIRISDNYRYEVEKLQQFIDETSFAVIVVDNEGCVTHFNEMAAKLLSLQPALQGEFLGEPFESVFEPGQGDVQAGLLRQALEGTKATAVPVMTGDKMLLNTTFFLRNSLNDKIEGAVLMAQDVTEIRQLRDEVGRMERLSLVGQMAASITHEIRNPMAVIRGFVQLIQERSPSTQHEYFRIVMEELDRANMIISDFLSLAQNRDLSMEEASLHDIINEIIPLLNADSNLRGQTLEVSFCDSLPRLMLNDREIKQLLLNLARNGMEAMGDKGLLRISTEYTGDRIELRISDEGTGIHPDKMKHLFEPFFTTKTQGTGLGLPLCLSIAERHNGQIDVESVEGEGTTFIVTFNLEPAGGTDKDGHSQAS